MSRFMNWLFNRDRTSQSSGEGSPTSRPRPEEDPGQGRRLASWTNADRVGTGLGHPWKEPLFVDFEALAQSQKVLFEGLAPLSEQAALVSFVGTGITEPSRYEDAAAAFNQLRLMAPVQEGALIQVFRQQLREESNSEDFLYVHFAGDPIYVGCLMCALSGGGLMAGGSFS